MTTEVEANVEKLIGMMADYIASRPKMFPNGPAALNVAAQGIEAWGEAGGRLEQMGQFFTKDNDGRFWLPPVRKFAAQLEGKIV